MQYPNEKLAKFHNEGKRTELQTRLLLMEGLLPGIADLVILAPRKPYHGLFIEMKRSKGGVTSSVQKQIIQSLNEKGYLAVVCAGFEAAMGVTRHYMSKEPW